MYSNNSLKSEFINQLWDLLYIRNCKCYFTICRIELEPHNRKNMAKEILTKLKLQIPAGGANPAPPVGPALGQHGLNIQDFCTQFNNATQDKRGEIVPVEITVYQDRTFSFVMKTPPAFELLKKAAGIKKGAGNPLTTKVGKVTMAQVKEIAEIKLPDLNTDDIDQAAKIVAGTARQGGIEVVD